MSHLNRKGPENIGPVTGRGLGTCKEKSALSEIEKLGIGMGTRRNSGGGKGKGKRLKTYLNYLPGK